MNKAEQDVRLAKIKLALADKCDRLIKITKSTPRRKTLQSQATKFRHQAADLSR